MLHLTNNKPKHIINVQQKPFLDYLLRNIFKAGYKEVVLVVGYKGEKIKEYLEQSRHFPPGAVKIVNQHKILGESEYGTLCPLKCVKDIVGREDFLMVCGDNLYSEKDLRRFGVEDEYSYIGAFRHQNPEKYGVIISRNGFLEKIIEKPQNPPTDLINTGLYKFTPEIFKVIPRVSVSPRGEYELTDAVSLLAKENKVKIKEIKEYWLDFGCPADIIKISRFLQKNGNIKS